MDKRSIHNTGRESSHHLSLSDIFRAPTHFQYAIFIHFPYLFKTKLKGFNTIISLHFSKLLFMEHNANNICRTVISGKEQSLNEQRVEKGKNPHLSSFSASIPFNFRSVSTTSASAFSMSFCRSRRDWLSSRSRCRSCVDNTTFRRSEHDEGKATVKYTQNVSQGQSKWPTRNTTKKMENADVRRH